MKALNVLAAFIGGAAVGAALGVLFAPEKGSDTREKIAEALRKKGIKLSKEDFNKLIDSIEARFRKKVDNEEAAEEIDE